MPPRGDVQKLSAVRLKAHKLPTHECALSARIIGLRKGGDRTRLGSEKDIEKPLTQQTR